MIKLFNLSMGMLLLMAGLLYAQPKAVIVGKDVAAVGESVWLKTNGSSGKNFVWKVFPIEAEQSFTPLPIFGGLDANKNPIIFNWGHFSSITPGNYYFLFIAVEGDNIDIALHQLKYGNPVPGPGPGPQPDVPDPTLEGLVAPTGALLTLVQPISNLIVGPTAKVDGKDLAYFYLELANQIERDGQGAKLFKDTSVLRDLNSTAGSLMFQQTGMKGRYSTLGATIDGILSTSIGLDIAVLDDAANKRATAIQALKAIAWATYQASKNAK